MRQQTKTEMIRSMFLTRIVKFAAQLRFHVDKLRAIRALRKFLPHFCRQLIAVI